MRRGPLTDFPHLATAALPAVVPGSTGESPAPHRLLAAYDAPEGDRAVSEVTPGHFPLVLRRVRVPGEQEWGRQQEETGDRDRGAGAGEGGQQAP